MIIKSPFKNNIETDYVENAKFECERKKRNELKRGKIGKSSILHYLYVYFFIIYLLCS